MTHLIGTWRLVRLALRRDRIKLSVSVLALGLFLAAVVSGVSEVFASDREMRQGISFLAANPAMRLFGLPTGSEFGNLVMLRGFTMLVIIASLISTFTVVRHTRQNEELGRSELLGSHVLGRHAPLTAALIVTAVANVAIAALAYLGLISNDLPVVGALAMALVLGMVGMTFAAFAAVAVQLTQTSRGANGLAAIGVITAFLISGVASVLGQLQPNGFVVEPIWMIWLSPIGWAQQLQPFTDEQWWVIGLFVSFFAACVAGAIWLEKRRDVGSSVFPSRAGEAKASQGLLSVTGLTWRLQKNSFITWLIGLSLLGVIYGVVAPDAEELFTRAEGIADVFLAATGTTEIMLAFFGSINGILGIFILAYAVSAILRIRAEEDRALEPLLSTRLSRNKWLISNVSFVVLSTVVMAAVIGLSTGVTVEVLLPNFNDITWSIVGGISLQLSAVVLVLSLIVMVFGFWPRATNAAAWSIVALAVVLGPLFSSLLNLPDGFENISPFSHVPTVPPATNLEWLPVLILVGLSVVFFAVGIIRFTNRDITTK